MEELLDFCCLADVGLDLEKEYEAGLHEMFLESGGDADLLALEEAGDISAGGKYIRTHIDYVHMARERFGRKLMELLMSVYKTADIREFGSRMFSLWESLPGNIQNEEPFFSLCFGDVPPCGFDEVKAREVFERMLLYCDKQ